MGLSKLALLIALVSPFLLSPAYAQRGGGHAGGGGHLGGAVRGGFSGGGAVGGGFRGGYYYGGRGYVYGGRYWGPSIYFGVGGWGYPYYSSYPYYGYDPYYYSYDPYTYGGSTYSTPPVTIQQNYGYAYPPQGQGQPPQLPSSSPQGQGRLAPPQQPQTQPQSSNGNNQGQNFYLIAFNDHTIQAATAYKVEGNQIHWITREGQEMQAPLPSVDVRFSQQINRDRHVDFQIP